MTRSQQSQLILLVLLTLLSITLGAFQTFDDGCGNQPRIRRNWATLSDGEKHRYLRAVVQLIRRPSPNYADFVRTHADAQFYAHGYPWFLFWHRWYLWRYETMLRWVARNELGYTQSQVCSLAAHYWASEAESDLRLTGNAPAVFSSSTFGGYYPGQNMCGVPDGYFNRSWYNVAMNVLNCPTLLRSIDSSISFRTESYVFQTVILGSNNFQTFWQREESDPHAAPHIFVGGYMRTMYSPNDPLFFLHHSNVDRIWALWTDVMDVDQIATASLTRDSHYAPVSSIEGYPASFDSCMPFSSNPTGLFTDSADSSNCVTPRNMYSIGWSGAPGFEGMYYRYETPDTLQTLINQFNSRFISRWHLFSNSNTNPNPPPPPPPPPQQPTPTPTPRPPPPPPPPTWPPSTPPPSIPPPPTWPPSTPPPSTPPPTWPPSTPPSQQPPNSNDQCSTSTNCVSCISRPTCGWCSLTSTCRSGTQNGASIGSTCGGSNWGWIGCPSGSWSPPPPTWSPPPPTWSPPPPTWSPPPPPTWSPPPSSNNMCASATTCAACIQLPVCGFCQSTYQCLQGTSTGVSSCPARSWSWVSCSQRVKRFGDDNGTACESLSLEQLQAKQIIAEKMENIKRSTSQSYSPYNNDIFFEANTTTTVPQDGFDAPGNFSCRASNIIIRSIQMTYASSTIERQMQALEFQECQLYRHEKYADEEWAKMMRLDTTTKWWIPICKRGISISALMGGSAEGGSVVHAPNALLAIMITIIAFMFACIIALAVVLYRTKHKVPSTHPSSL